MTLQQQTVESLLEAIGARTPTPGGGAVASLVGAIGAALGRMALGYSINRRVTEDQCRDFQGAIEHLIAISRQMLDLAEQDAQAYALLDQLQRLSEDDPNRVSRWGEAVRGAVRAPMAVVEASCGLVGLLEAMAETCNARLLSDLAIAAILGEAAARSGAWNVLVNLPLVTSPAERTRLTNRLADRLASAASSAYRVEVISRRRAPL
jgi:formiminotetrahydrofolate cyclodeaminase